MRLFVHFVKIRHGPGDEITYQGHEAAAHRGERVLDAWRHLGIEEARHQTVTLEVFKGRGEDFERDVGDGLADGVETGGVVLGKHTEHKHGPFAREARNDVAHRATVDAGEFFQIFLQG